jgi:hypothetical protein
MMRPEARVARATAGEWKRAATVQTMHDGSVLPAWGVLVSGTLQWVGKGHAIGQAPEQQAEALVNAGLFAASKAMAAVLEEATQAWARQFDGVADEDCSISGADLLDWFAQWRLRAKTALDMVDAP